MKVIIDPTTSPEVKRKAEDILLKGNPKSDGSYWIDHDDHMTLMLNVDNELVAVDFKQKGI